MHSELTLNYLHMAAVDIPGFVTELKDHAMEHGFHVHDERHFVETYSMRQAWEVDLHPEDACGEPLDLHLNLDVEPRILLAFEDQAALMSDDETPEDSYHILLSFTWELPPADKDTDLLRLAIDLSAIAGVDLPLEVSAIDTTASPTDSPVRKVAVVGRTSISLAQLYSGEDTICPTLDKCLEISKFLLAKTVKWTGE